LSKQLEKITEPARQFEDFEPTVEKLRKREGRYCSIVKNQTELICRFLSDRQLIFVNDACCQYFSKKYEDLIGQNVIQFIPTEDRYKFDKHLGSLSRKNPIGSIGCQVLKPNGEIGWQQWINRAIFDARGRVREYQSVGRDITEHVQKLQKLQENERFLQNIFEAIQDGISVLDKDLNILWVNPTMTKWYPQSGPFEGKKCHRIYHGRKKACQNCPAIRAIETCSLQMEIVPWIVSKKRVGWQELYAYPFIGSAGKPSGVVEYVRDVTERVNAEHALLESEQRFRTVADFTYDWEYWIAPDRIFLYVSPSCERITGYAADEFIKDVELLEKIVHPDDRSLVSKHLKKDLSSKDVTSFDFRILTRAGEERCIGHICQPVYDDEGQLLGRRSTNQDITDRKRAEGTLRETHEDLEHRVQERTIQLKTAAEELTSKQKELLYHKSELEKLNKELIETNKAITILAKNIEKNRQGTENTIAKSINLKIMPIIKDLRKAKSLDRIQSKLDVLSVNLQNLNNELTNDTNLLESLTPTEVRVAMMIKNGLTNQRIAEKLHISLHTAKTHRRNIRKKLHIQNSSINLISYLQSIMW
jgi:PAS domain S-box-containing protein